MLAVIGKVLVCLRKRLDDYLRVQLAEAGDDPVADKVVFLDGDKMDPISFQDAAVSELVINVEEERLLRAAEPYARVQEDGKPLRKHPDLRLVLYVLFVARFKQYDLAWDHLAKIIEYLQSNRTFERADYPELPAGVDRLTFELMTQSFTEQNNIWNALRTTYHPSALYRVQLVVLRDVKPVLRDQITQPIVVNVHRV
jgi:Pvc16 N-terminal domain